MNIAIPPAMPAAVYFPIVIAQLSVRRRFAECAPSEEEESTAGCRRDGSTGGSGSVWVYALFRVGWAGVTGGVCCWEVSGSDDGELAGGGESTCIFAGGNGTCVGSGVFRTGGSPGIFTLLECCCSVSRLGCSFSSFSEVDSPSSTGSGGRSGSDSC